MKRNNQQTEGNGVDFSQNVWYSNKAVRQGGGRLEGSPKGPKKTVDKREPMW